MKKLILTILFLVALPISAATPCLQYKLGGTGYCPTANPVVGTVLTASTTNGITYFFAPTALPVSFSTSSADYWIGTFPLSYFWSTTSADFWNLTANNLWSDNGTQLVATSTRGLQVNGTSNLTTTTFSFFNNTVSSSIYGYDFPSGSVPYESGLTRSVLTDVFGFVDKSFIWNISPDNDASFYFGSYDYNKILAMNFQTSTENVLFVLKNTTGAEDINNFTIYSKGLDLLSYNSNPILKIGQQSGDDTQLRFLTSTDSLNFENASGGYYFDDDLIVTGSSTLATTTASQLTVGTVSTPIPFDYSLAIGGISYYEKIINGSNWLDLGAPYLIGLGSQYSTNYVTATSTGGEDNVYVGNVNVTNYQNSINLIYGISNQLNTLVESGAEITTSIGLFGNQFNFENAGTINGIAANTYIESTNDAGIITGDYHGLLVGDTSGMSTGGTNYAIKTGNGLVSFGDDVSINNGGSLSVNGTTTASYFSGSLGVGTTTPISSLDVYSASSTGMLAYFYNSSQTLFKIFKSVTNGLIAFFGDDTNHTGFEADGTLKMEGSATVCNDANVGFVSLGAGATAPDLVQASTSDIYLRCFGGTATIEQLFGCIELPHDYKESSNIYPHLHWMPSTNGAGDVKWQVSWVRSNGQGTDLPAQQTISATSSAIGYWKNSFADFGEVTTTAKIGDQLCFRIFRDPTDPDDNYADDACGMTFGIHYEQDTLGSRLIITK